MQIYHAQHYTTLFTNNDRYYRCDGLGIAVPNNVSHLHDRLRQWYGDSIQPPVLRLAAPTVHTPYTPQQTNDWNFSMHMLLTSLSALYQSHVPILHYGQRHVDQLSRAHLRYVLTGEKAPWTVKLITYISDPLNNEDPEPHSKSYSAGGTELPEQELVRKTSKRKKTQ